MIYVWLLDAADASNFERVRGRDYFARIVRHLRAFTAMQRLAGSLAGRLCRLVYGMRYTDMSPFRAIRRDCLAGLDMREETYGWNLEMQMQAARAGLRIIEIPVDHRRRAGGVSKVSGNVRGTIAAAVRITRTFVRIAAARRTRPHRPGAITSPDGEASARGQ